MKDVLYLHKKKNNKFTTTKDIIVANINEVDHPYRYKKNAFKEPSTLIINGISYKKDFIDSYKDGTYRFVQLIDFPVEKVIIDTDLETHHKRLIKFNIAKVLEISENVLFCEIYDNLGLKQLENIIIPYSIIGFNNKSIFNNKIKTITIKDKDSECIIDIDDICLGKTGEIEIERNNNGLNIYIGFKDTVINYSVKKQNQEFIVKKEYLKYDLSNYAKEEELNIIDLKNKYDCGLCCKENIESKKIILSKGFYNLLSELKFNNLKEIDIIDINEMALIPKNNFIKLSMDEKIEKIEEYNDSLLIKVNKNGSFKYIIINNESKIYEIKDLISNEYDLPYLKYLYFSYDDDDIKFDKNIGSLIIPIRNNFDTTNNNIINDFTIMAENIYVKKDKRSISLKRPFRGFRKILFGYTNDFNVIYNNKSYVFIDIYCYDSTTKNYKIHEEMRPIDTYRNELKIKQLRLKK